MDAISVVVIPELIQLPLKINRVPEERAIQILSPDRADQPFDERMGNRRVRHRLDLLDLKYPQIGQPPVESEQRVVIGADVFGQGLARDGVIEHPTYGDAVDVSTLDTEAEDTTGEHVHDDQHPVTVQENRFAAEQVDATGCP